MEEERVELDAAPTSMAFELHFSPRELVKSVLREPDGTSHETGVKGAEVRWQQGAIAVCLLAVFTRLKSLEGAAETPILEGERGSPARSLDNLLNKPGDWALQMFGEHRGQPRLREIVYRKRTVSRSNPISAVQWDASVLDPSEIRVWQAGEELTTPEALRGLIRTLLEEFNPRRAAREWETLFPAPLPEEADSLLEGTAPEKIAGTGTGMTPVPLPLPDSADRGASPEAGKTRRLSWGVALGLAVALLIALGFFIGRASSETKAGAESPLASAGVVESFIDHLNAGDLEGAYDLTSKRFRAVMPPDAFAVAYGDQRYNFPRLAGNPYRNTADASAHDYRVALYVETRVHRIPALDGLARIPLTQLDAYARRIGELEASLRTLGIDEGVLNQLRKERLERPDASRHVQLVCGLSETQMDSLFPEEIATTLDLTLFFEVVLETGDWRIQSIEDASERLVAF